MSFVHDKLRQYGYTEEKLAALERWDKIDLLREISNNNEGELNKFKREIRMTTKMQKEKYQNDINDLLMTQIGHLTVQNWSDISSDEEFNVVEDMSKLIEAEENEIAHYRSLKSEDEEGQEDDEMESGQGGRSDSSSSEDESEEEEAIVFGD